MLTLDRWRHRPGFRLGAASDSKSRSSAATRGIAYHKRVYKRLQLLATDNATLHIEPWFERVDGQVKRTMRSPDAVLDYGDGTALVIEVKMNWKDGRDDKLIREYLPIVRSAFDLDLCWPLLITSNLRGYPHPPLLGLSAIDAAIEWRPGQPTPLLLLP